MHIDGSTFTMTNGDIVNNTGQYGGGVYVGGTGNNSTFIMNGGFIQYNTASTASGLGVWDSNTAILRGGTISGNIGSPETMGNIIH
jgi:hypothetical protein